LICVVLFALLSACNNSRIDVQDISGQKEEIKATLNAMWAAIEKEAEVEVLYLIWQYWIWGINE